MNKTITIRPPGNWGGGARQAAGRNRRGGSVIVFVALSMVMILGISALVVDQGYFYTRRADAQKAADAAALAAAYDLAFNEPSHTYNSNVAQVAINYAAQNGYTNGDAAGTTVTVTPSWQGNGNYLHVQVARPEPMFFGGIFGGRKKTIGAGATALYTLKVTIPIEDQYYGLNTGPYNYSDFGPYAYHSYGDHIGTKYLNDGTANPDYNGKGFDYTVKIPSNYTALNSTSIVQVEVFDPECINDGSNPSIDEIRSSNPASPQSASHDYTNTNYALIWDKDGDPSNADPTDHVTIAQKSYGPETAVQMKWVTPSGFKFDSRLYPTGSVRVNVVATDGASENGFNLRAGPPQTASQTQNLGSGLGTASKLTDAQWHDQFSGAAGTSKAGRVNGTNVGAFGDIQVNFNTNGTADILLGNVPASCAGGSFSINKFDTDVGAQSVYYTCDSLPGQTFPGVLAGNDQFQTDIIQLPSNYSGGNWHAFYSAGAADTSSWTLSYSNGNGTPASIRLIQ